MDQFLDELGRATPTPAGGAASCYVGATSAALIEMVAGFGLKKGHAVGVSIAERARKLRMDFISEAEKDSAAFERVLAAYRRPKADPDRQASIALALRDATMSPLRILDLVLALAQIIRESEAVCPASAHSDWESAIVFCRAVANVSAGNATSNLGEAQGADELKALLREKLDRLAQALPQI